MEEKNEPRAGVTILSFQKIAKTGRVQWAGHVVRMPDKNAVKLCLLRMRPVQDVRERSELGGKTKWSKSRKCSMLEKLETNSPKPNFLAKICGAGAVLKGHRTSKSK